MKKDGDFLEKVRAGLEECGVPSGCGRIGVGVSGGADSVSLLLSLVGIFGAGRVFCATVNHNIRPPEESAGDAEFVGKLCGELGVSFSLFEIERGKVESISGEFGGIEGAARKLRYEAFSRFFSEKRLDFLCLAHSADDNLETIAMRFLQGSGTDGEGGIARAREARGMKIVRPLLGIGRAEIEEFLGSRGQGWRTDSSNSDENFLRNRIRRRLLPELDWLFPGWRKSVLLGAEKKAADNATLEKIADGFSGKIESAGNRVSVDITEFYSLDDSIKRRVFHSMLSEVGFRRRFPHRHVQKIQKIGPGERFALDFGGISVRAENSVLSVERIGGNGGGGNPAERGFLEIREVGGRKFAFRSVQAGDSVLSADGRRRRVQKILSSWKVPAGERWKIPVVQDAQSLEVVAVLGGKFGFPDWIVGGLPFFFSSADI